jgi:hypothetical protein
MAQLGANAHGEILEPGRVSDCYLGLRLDPPGHTEPAGVLVVAPTALLHPHIPRRRGDRRLARRPRQGPPARRA